MKLHENKSLPAQAKRRTIATICMAIGCIILDIACIYGLSVFVQNIPRTFEPSWAKTTLLLISLTIGTFGSLQILWFFPNIMGKRYEYLGCPTPDEMIQALRKGIKMTLGFMFGIQAVFILMELLVLMYGFGTLTLMADTHELSSDRLTVVCAFALFAPIFSLHLLCTASYTKELLHDWKELRAIRKTVTAV